MANNEDDVVKYLHFKDPFVEKGEAKKLKLRPDTLDTYKEVLEKMSDTISVSIEEKPASDLPVPKEHPKEQGELGQQMPSVLADVIELSPLFHDEKDRTSLKRATRVAQGLQRALLARPENIEAWKNTSLMFKNRAIKTFQKELEEKNIETEKIETMVNQSPVRMQAAINVVNDAFDEVLNRARTKKTETSVRSLFGSSSQKEEPTPASKEMDEDREALSSSASSSSIPMDTPGTVTVENAKEDESGKDYTVYYPEFYEEEDNAGKSQQEEEVNEQNPSSLENVEEAESSSYETSEQETYSTDDMRQYFQDDEEVQSVLEEIASKDREITQLNRKYDDLSARHRTLLQENQTELEQVNRSSKDLEEAKRKYREIKAAFLKDLKQKLEQRNNTIDDARSKNREIEEENKKLQTETDQYKQQHEENKRQINGLKVTVESIEQHLGGLRIRNQGKSGSMSSFGASFEEENHRKK